MKVYEVQPGAVSPVPGEFGDWQFSVNGHDSANDDGGTAGWDTEKLAQEAMDNYVIIESFGKVW